MVVLVRCDDVYSLALQSRLDELIKDGLVSAFLHNGQWVATGHIVKRDSALNNSGRLAAFVSCF